MSAIHDLKSENIKITPSDWNSETWTKNLRQLYGGASVCAIIAYLNAESSYEEVPTTETYPRMKTITISYLNGKITLCSIFPHIREIPPSVEFILTKKTP
ncbi:hypothetical protein C2W64_00515 [Brevibacillus laterosporus]|nr:hypothetical protein [Brevibacillus laterosporus]RAP28049.1 hypothetical protein C2W64_00515 [Brevibacillus laterosporus]